VVSNNNSFNVNIHTLVLFFEEEFRIFFVLDGREQIWSLVFRQSFSCKKPPRAASKIMPSSKLQPRSKLAPVLEEHYMGAPHVDYETDAGDVQLQQKQLRATAAAAGAPKQLLGRSSKPGCKETGSKKALESISPLRLLGKLRDRYVRMMNDMAEKGDMIAVGLAGYHGAVATPYSYPCCSTRATTMTKDYNLDSSCEQLLNELFFRPNTESSCQKTQTQAVTKPWLDQANNLYTPLVDHFHVLCFSTMALQQAAAAALGRVH
jgi:hypothetical protein